MRSAELTLQSGYKYFTIINSGTSVLTSTFVTPKTYNTTANIYGSQNNIYGSAITTQSGGQSYNISKPRTTNTIVCFKEKPSDVMSYNASFISKNIKEKYQLND